MRFLLLIGLTAAVLFFAGCEKDKPKPNKPEGSMNLLPLGSLVQPGSKHVLTITDELGQPVAGAQVLIGYAVGNPFASNFLRTGPDGRAALPAEWTEELPVTVGAPGFIRQTLYAVAPSSVSIRLRRVQAEPSIELRGVTTGHIIKDRDNQVDFGMVLTALNRQDLLAFDLYKVISPRSDKLAVPGGEVNLPSNIALPRQRENYIIPITLEKPQYRIYFSEPGIKRVFAAQGRFPFKEVVGEFRSGKSIPDVINYFSINGGSLRDINITPSGALVDLPVTDLIFNVKRTATTGNFSSDETLIAIALADMNGYFVPTDIKKMDRNSRVGLNVLPNHSPLLVQAIKKTSEFDKEGTDRVSAVIQPFVEGATANPLPLISAPVVKGKLLELPTPNPRSAVHPLATHLILSQVKTAKTYGFVKVDAQGRLNKGPTTSA
ncbi:MAG: carboxypeptidase-like regulatory domain-containing protein, partial [Bdellovibrionaceae bacterium]|nr:carboxypeptidase-like regulatory domain-containing protein [Pseudobdellovibrionaceae bacterium]